MAGTAFVDRVNGETTGLVGGERKDIGLEWHGMK
jgi:hypothetical protein